MNGGVAIVVEVDPERIEKRLPLGTAVSTDSIDEALRLAEEARGKGGTVYSPIR